MGSILCVVTELQHEISTLLSHVLSARMSHPMQLPMGIADKRIEAKHGNETQERNVCLKKASEEERLELGRMEGTSGYKRVGD